MAYNCPNTGRECDAITAVDPADSVSRIDIYDNAVEACRRQRVMDEYTAGKVMFDCGLASYLVQQAGETPVNLPEVQNA